MPRDYIVHSALSNLKNCSCFIEIIKPYRFPHVGSFTFTIFLHHEINERICHGFDFS